MGRSVNFKNVMRKVFFVLGIIVCLVMLGISMAIYNDTLIRWWIPVAMGVGLGVMTGVPYHSIWRRFTNYESRIANFLIHLVVVSTLWIFGMLGGNYIFADKSSSHIEKVAVEKKQRETRHRTRRVSRRSYVRGEPYYVYNITVKFEDGRTKKMEVLKKRYDRIHKGDTLTFTVQRGLFGFPIIETPSK